MSDHGHAVAVEQETLGSELAEDVAAGASSVTVTQPFDFDENGGGFTLGAESGTFTDVDKDTGEITLSAPLASGHSAGDRVDLSPVGKRHWAQVLIDDAEGDPALARVEHGLLALIRRGLRTGDQPSVELERRDGDLWVRNVLGDEPALTGTSLDIPDADNPAAHIGDDGEAIFQSITIQNTPKFGTAARITRSSPTLDALLVFEDEAEVVRAFVGAIFELVVQWSIDVTDGAGVTKASLQTGGLVLGDSQLSELANGVLLAGSISGGKGLYLEDVGAALGNPSGNRVVLYNNGGALFWRGPTGAPHAL